MNDLFDLIDMFDVDDPDYPIDLIDENEISVNDDILMDMMDDNDAVIDEINAEVSEIDAEAQEYLDSIDENSSLDAVIDDMRQIRRASAPHYHNLVLAYPDDYSPGTWLPEWCTWKTFAIAVHLIVLIIFISNGILNQ